MTRILVLVALAAVVALPFGRAAAVDPPKPLKGYELYSWHDEKKGWQFAVVTGTNELKTEKQVKGAATVFTGSDKMLDGLKKLPKGASVVWSHLISGFEYPPESEVKSIREAAKAAGIDLRVPEN